MTPFVPIDHHCSHETTFVNISNPLKSSSPMEFQCISAITNVAIESSLSPLALNLMAQKMTWSPLSPYDDPSQDITIAVIQLQVAPMVTNGFNNDHLAAKSNNDGVYRWHYHRHRHWRQWITICSIFSPLKPMAPMQVRCLIRLDTFPSNSNCCHHWRQWHHFRHCSPMDHHCRNWITIVTNDTIVAYGAPSF